MAVSAAEARFLDSISLDAPWSLVEAFSTMPRWRPEDVNAGADHIASVLTRLGVPVTVHEPEIYLSIPLRAEVARRRDLPRETAVDVDQRARGRSRAVSSISRPTRTRTGPTPATPPRSSPARAATSARGSKARSSSWPASPIPAHCSLLEEWGGKGRDRGQPRRRHPLGHLHHDLGLARPRRPAAQAGDRRRRRQQSRRAEADRARRHGRERDRRAPRCWRAGSRRRSRSSTIPGAVEPDRVRPAPRPLRLLARRHRRQRHRRRDAARTRPRVLGNSAASCAARCGSPGGAATRPGATPARPGTPTPSRSTSTRTASRRSTATAPAAAGRRATTRPRDERDARTSCRRRRSATSRRADAKAKRPHRAGDYSFNNIGMPSYLHALLDHAGRLCARRRATTRSAAAAANIAWHTEDDTLEIADRDNLLRRHAHLPASVLRIANAAILPFDWRATGAEFKTTLAAYEAAAARPRRSLARRAPPLDAL